MAVRHVRLDQKPHSGFALDRRRIEKPATPTEATIDLLKSDDFSAELSDHFDDAIGTGEAVGAAAFVDVVGRNFHDNLYSDSFIYSALTAASPRPGAL